MPDLILQKAPPQYNRQWMEFFLRDLRLFLTSLANESQQVFATLTLTNVAQSGYGLTPGTVFERPDELGRLYIVLMDVVYAPSFLMTSYMGTAVASHS